MKLTLLLAGTIATTASAVSLNSIDQPSLLRGKIQSKLSTSSDPEFGEMNFDTYDLLALAESTGTHMDLIQMELPEEVDEVTKPDSEKTTAEMSNTVENVEEKTTIPSENSLVDVDGVLPEDMDEEFLQMIADAGAEGEDDEVEDDEKNKETIFKSQHFQGDVAASYDEITQMFGKEVAEEAKEEGELDEEKGGLIEETSRNLLSVNQGGVPTKHYRSLWPEDTVYVVLSAGMNNKAKAAVDQAMRFFNEKTILTFKYGTGKGNYLYIVSQGGCWSYIGMTGGQQKVSIGSGCEWNGIVQHEFLHALGMWHEQSSPTRDKYVTILWQNIIKGKEHNFKKKSTNDVDEFGSDFDYSSVMMYGDTSFAKARGLKTIDCRGHKCGQYHGMVASDIFQINKLYTMNQPHVQPTPKPTPKATTRTYIRGWCGHAGAYMNWGDVNGDGIVDAICNDNYGRTWVGFHNGAGSFTTRYLGARWCSHGGSRIQYADINGDGKIDKICDDTAGRHWIMISTGSQFVYWGNSHGYQYGGWCSHPGSKTQYADINGDGKADMICDDSAGRHWVRLSTGVSTRWVDWGYQFGGWCSHSGSYTQYADVNGDGKADMHCDDSRGNHWIQLSTGRNRNWGNWGYQAANRGWCGHSGSRTSWADVNGDKKADMLCDDSAGRHWVRLSTGSSNRYVDWGYQFGGWCSHSGSYARWIKSFNKDSKADIFCDDNRGNHWCKATVSNRSYRNYGHL